MNFILTEVMLHKRRFFLKWISIIIAYICIFLLSYEYGTSKRHIPVEEVTNEPRHLTIKRLFYDHVEYLNSSMILNMINKELKQLLPFEMGNTNNQTSNIRHGLVVFYDFSNHHILFQQFLWLYSSWIQLRQHTYIQNDLILFISSSTIPNDFKKLKNITKSLNNKNQFIIYPCTTLIDSILNKNYKILNNFSIHFHMELARLFYWQQTRLSSLLLFLIDEYKNKLLIYDYIFRLDIDSFLMSNFYVYQQTSSFILGESIPYDQYTLNRLERIQKYFYLKSKSKIMKQSITISWFGRLNFISKLTREIILMALWLIKEEFTESERLHHLTYLNYPSWYIDGLLEYATAIILSLNQYEKFYDKIFYQFDCHHVLTNCLHISFRDPSHHLHLSKHSLRLLTNINQSNLTNNELYIYRTVIKSNGMFQLYFS
ncbi:unnamed protein product [Rotaria sordida]|uniref:DUF7164 domain-containing protein n=1 Tax=Rotaria sordida TaxID=392033 RepID=A0A813SH69_9BILA|nr:unnamed protein product [Rotaria sordida]CAF0988862.1 unnamed protein product [Rotaria sordida]CAF3573909.1 unnamed protein product [Rotaria sordida]